MNNLALYRYGHAFHFTHVQELVKNGKAIDAINGGILKGPTHAEGGINVLMRFREEYRLVVELEGGEYWLNARAAQRYIDSGSNWNDMTRDSCAYEPITDYLGLQVIDCTSTFPDQHSKFLLVDSRSPLAWFNRYSTSRYIYDLEYLNLDSEFMYEEEPEVWSNDWATRFHGRFSHFREYQSPPATNLVMAHGYPEEWVD